jgi:hypothetical protein
MSDSDNELVKSDCGCVTPDLSPSKTLSTEGWTSPRTPMSNRRTRSCLIFSDVETSVPDRTPPDSPTKAKSSLSFDVLQFADVPRLVSSNAGFPIQKSSRYLDGCSPIHSSSSTSSNTHFPPIASTPVKKSSDLISSGTPINIASDRSSLSEPETHSDCSFILASPTQEQAFAPSDTTSPTIPDLDHESPGRSASTNTSAITSPTGLHQFPLRHASSPLRPSQWVARGGLLTSPRYQTRTPDRFIPFRRPPNVTRQSFELNKPTERLTIEERLTRNGVSTPDPFGRRLHRSGRLNDELRGIRETHSALTGRTSMNRRAINPSLRQSSFTQGARNFSAGAVWNVGGSSAASDTVVAVSNGRGGMLGSGTNAPLYTSMFLNRSDPEAELEAYEQRLAIALDVDRTDRILHYHPSMSNSVSRSSSSPPTLDSCTKHIWRDNAWTKDGVVTARLLSPP